MPDENKVRKAAASVRTYVSEKGKIIPDLLTMDTNGVLCRKSQDKDDRNDFMYIFYISFLPVFLPLLFLPELHTFCRLPSSGVRLGSVMTPCGINVFVAQYIGYQVNIPRLLVEVCTERTAQFMGSNMFDRSYQLRIFFYQLFH